MTQPTSLTYRDAGVNIDAGNELVERIKQGVPIWKNQHFTNGASEWVGLDDHC